MFVFKCACGWSSCSHSRVVERATLTTRIGFTIHLFAPVSCSKRRRNSSSDHCARCFCVRWYWRRIPPSLTLHAHGQTGPTQTNQSVSLFNFNGEQGDMTEEHQRHPFKRLLPPWLLFFPFVFCMFVRLSVPYTLLFAITRISLGGRHLAWFLTRRMAVF